MPRRDPTDNWFNNGVNHLYEKHRWAYILLMVVMFGALFILKTLRWF